MARGKYNFEKRKREAAKQKKRLEKRLRKKAKREGRVDADGNPIIDPEELAGVRMPSIGGTEDGPEPTGAIVGEVAEPLDPGALDESEEPPEEPSEEPGQPPAESKGEQ